MSKRKLEHATESNHSHRVTPTLFNASVSATSAPFLSATLRKAIFAALARLRYQFDASRSVTVVKRDGTVIGPISLAN